VNRHETFDRELEAAAAAFERGDIDRREFDYQEWLAQIRFRRRAPRARARRAVEAVGGALGVVAGVTALLVGAALFIALAGASVFDAIHPDTVRAPVMWRYCSYGAVSEAQLGVRRPRHPELRPFAQNRGGAVRTRGDRLLHWRRPLLRHRRSRGPLNARFAIAAS
jgi:hypothetical protein